jgi:hypothetical protein
MWSCRVSTPERAALMDRAAALAMDREAVAAMEFELAQLCERPHWLDREGAGVGSCARSAFCREESPPGDMGRLRVSGTRQDRDRASISMRSGSPGWVGRNT